MGCAVSDLTINISKLSEGSHLYDFETDPQNLELDARFKGPVLAHATLQKVGRQIRLKADVETNGRFTCDRCLDEFDRNLSTHFEILYVTEEGAAPARTEDEIQYINPDATIVDLGEDVRQFLILAIPQKLLCSDECRGLCPVCGSNRNKVGCTCTRKEKDPRWEALRKLSFN